MSFRFYSNMMSQASRALAAGTFIIGMILIGFGFLIYLLPRFFATLAAIVFFIIGAGSCITAVKIFLVQRRLDKMNSDAAESYRQNVRVRIEQNHED